MENEQQTQYELRSRSRSRSVTPQTFKRNLFNDDNSDSHYNLRSCSREKSATPEVTSSTKKITRSTKSLGNMKVKKNIMDCINESMDNTLIDSWETQSNHSDQSVSLIKPIRKPERRSERQKMKKQIAADSPSGEQDDVSDTKSETYNDKRDSVTPKRTMTSDYSSEDGDREDVSDKQKSAYEFYKKQGEWWNKFPKTDYTYSPLSNCRYEVAPGIMAIPNMSRRSLRGENSIFNSSQESLNRSTTANSSDDTIFLNSNSDLSDIVKQSSHSFGQEIIYKKRQLEQYNDIVYNNNVNRQNRKNISLSSPNIKPYFNGQNKSSNGFDSDGDLDEEILINNYSSQKKSSNLLLNIFYSIISIITFGYYNRQRSSHINYYSQKESTWKRIIHLISSIMHCFYLIPVKILLLDSWILSKVHSIRGKLQGRRSKIIWIALFPLALTAACWLLLYIFNSIPYSSKHVLPKIQSGSSSQKFDEQITNLKIELAKYSKLVSNLTNNLENLANDLENAKFSAKESQIQYKIQLDKNQNLEEKIEEIRKVYMQLNSQNKDCNDELEKNFEKLFLSYFGDNLTKQDVINIFQTINLKTLKNDIEANSDSDIKNQPALNTNVPTDDLRKIFAEMLKVYDADKTGKVDYALESAGGQIISTRCTQKYNVYTRAFKILGLTLYYESNNPRTVIQGNAIQPGMCWAFQDFPGYLLIKLRSFIHVTGFTMEHAPKSNLPNGEIKSAPRKFNVLGLKSEDDPEPVIFGEYEFADSDESLQYFPVQNESITTPYEFVELRIHSNHGQLEYTCLYRFRVHGKLAPNP